MGHIPRKLKCRRWDRFYQYRYHSIMQYRKEHADQTKINKKLVYTKYKMIENCKFDEKRLDNFYEEDAVEIGSHGLPKGYEWKLQCPVLALKLKDRGDGRYFCH